MPDETATQNPYDTVIADLEGKREQLSAMIESLRQMKSIVNSLPMMPAVATAHKTPAAEFSHDSFFGMTINDAAKTILQARKKTIPHPELCDMMLDHGLKTSASNFRETARAGMARNPEFVKVNSEWGLSEWYPGLKRDRKKRGSFIPVASDEPDEDDAGSKPEAA